MPRQVRILLLMLAISLSLVAAAGAQDAGSEAPAVAPAPMAADLLDPDLLELLTEMWGPVEPTGPLVTDGGNVTVLAVPESCAVYIASVSEIEAAGDSGGQSTVEAVVFNDEHYVGNTPLTVAVPSGQHVLAVRSTARRNGFDGGCVRKTTYDVITGGRRHAYHLYPLTKKTGQYQCFVANFARLDEKPSDSLLDLARRGTFAVPLGDLAARLASTPMVGQDDLERVATQLNQVGVSLFRKNGAEYLVKLIVLGNDYLLLDWPVEEE
jgi:hypothetical protein